MRTTIRTALRSLQLATLASLGLGFGAGNAAAQAVDHGAGGTYTGPGDTVPGGGGRAGGAVILPGSRGGNTPVVQPNAPGPLPVVRPHLPPIGFPGSPFETKPVETPVSRPQVADPTSWQLWWHYNRWQHLELGTARQANASTGSSGYYLGRGEKHQIPPTLRASSEQIRNLVTPALASAVEDGSSADARTFALQALGLLRRVEYWGPGTDSFTTLADSLVSSGNQLIAERGVLALGIHGSPLQFTSLAAILGDEADGRKLTGRSRVGTRIRCFAAYGLGLMGEQSNDPVMRMRIHAALSRAMHAERDDVQAACLLAIGFVPLPWEENRRLGDEIPAGARTRGEQIMEVLRLYEDPTNWPLVRSQAPSTLARLLDGAPEDLRERVAHALLETITPHTDETRECVNGAVLALGQIGRGGAAPIDVEIREELERVAMHANVDRLSRYLATVALAEASSRAGDGEEPYAGLDHTRKVLLGQLARTRGQALCWTALALGLLEENAAERGDVPSPDVGAALRDLLEFNRSPDVVGAVAVSLGLLKDQECQHDLRMRLRKASEASVVGYTALALGMIGARSAIDEISSALEEAGHKPFALQQTAIALSLLGEQDTGARLFEMLTETSDPEVQASIAAALGWIQDPRPLPDLCQRVLDPDVAETSRAWSSVALGRICDEAAWPWVGRWSVGVNYDVDLPTLLEPEFQTGLLDLP